MDGTFRLLLLLLAWRLLAFWFFWNGVDGLVDGCCKWWCALVVRTYLTWVSSMLLLCLDLLAVAQIGGWKLF
jgi:hypothetical protein